MEGGKDPISKGGQTRVLPQLFLLFLLLCFGFSVISIYMIKHFGALSVMNSTLKPSLDSCIVERPNGLEDWIRPRPPTLSMHSMSDEELFWRASWAPRVRKYPFERVPKIAFLFLTKGPLPLAPLWERFFRGGHRGLFSIYVHSSPSFEARFPPSSVFYRRQIPSQVTNWGTMSICDAERRLIANALLDISNEWFILLSESCVPLFNFTVVYSYISGSNYSFIDAFDDFGPYGRGRYNASMAPEVNITEWRKGSQWFEIDRNLALYIVEDARFHPKFAKFCKPHCYVDEHYFPTLLTIRAGSALANRSVTWADWSRGGAHPATFGGSDVLPEFVKGILEGHTCVYNGQSSSICHLFARKFAPSALEPLILLAQEYLGF